MKFSIIIVSYNTKEYLKKCLLSIQVNNSDNSFEIVVVDNASTDGTVQILENEFPYITLIKNNKNVGFGRANNQGANIAKGEYLFFLNSDTVLLKSAFQKIKGSIDNLPSIGAIGFQILNKDNTIQLSCGNYPTLANLFLETTFINRIFKKTKSYHILDTNKYSNRFYPDWVSGSCFMIRKKIFSEINGFDENLFLYAEDVDLCYRINQKGYKNIFIPHKTAIHFNQSSSENKKPAIIFTHHNLIYFFRKHYGIFSTLILYVLFSIKSIIYSVLGLLIGIVNKNQRIKAKSYFYLLITLISKNTLRNYENTFKQ